MEFRVKFSQDKTVAIVRRQMIWFGSFNGIYLLMVRTFPVKLIIRWSKIKSQTFSQRLVSELWIPGEISVAKPLRQNVVFSFYCHGQVTISGPAFTTVFLLWKRMKYFGLYSTPEKFVNAINWSSRICVWGSLSQVSHRFRFQKVFRRHSLIPKACVFKFLWFEGCFRKAICFRDGLVLTVGPAVVRKGPRRMRQSSCYSLIGW